MKKSVVILVLCSFLLCCITGCADVAESWSEMEVNREVEALAGEQVAVTATPIEEGYYVVEGILSEINKSELLLEIEDGQIMHFKLAPETIVYAGENKELSAGQNIKVVFDGEVSEEEIMHISVIEVTLLEEGL